LSAESKSKRTLTSEITSWIKKEVESSDDPIVRQVFGDRDYEVGDYFYQADSLRLRSSGYKLLKVFFDCEEFKHEREFYVGEILTLSKHMNAPFFISGTKIVLFSHEHIVLCKLAGSVALWLENFP
jgi:hypothetical protein